MQETNEVGTTYYCTICGEPVLKIIGITFAECFRIKQLKSFSLICSDCKPR